MIRVICLGLLQMVAAGLRMMALSRSFQRVYVYRGVGKVTQTVKQLVMHILGDSMSLFHGDV